ncbi:MAG: hypothetical protein AB1508_18970 [Pseudomonadota bacterium]
MTKYGLQGQDAPVIATPESATITGGTSCTHTFSTPVRKAWIALHPDATETFFVRFNADSIVTDGSGANWNIILSNDGIAVAASPDGQVLIATVEIDVKTGESVTFGTDYIVAGWE